MNNKYVQLLLGGGALVLAYLLSLTVEWVWGYFAKPNDLGVYALSALLTAVAVVVAWRSDKVRGGAAEVVGELEKVTWPSRKETSVATVVVMVTVTIASLILSAFDGVWSLVTGRLLG